MKGFVSHILAILLLICRYTAINLHLQLRLLFIGYIEPIDCRISGFHRPIRQVRNRTQIVIVGRILSLRYIALGYACRKHFEEILLLFVNISAHNLLEKCVRCLVRSPGDDSLQSLVVIRLRSLEDIFARTSG